MKPTISTSPVVWSCTTAGMRPSSFEKSIDGSTFTSSGSEFGARGAVQKKPRLVSGGAALVASSGLVAWAFSSLARAVRPAGRNGRGDGDARGGERRTCWISVPETRSYPQGHTGHGEKQRNSTHRVYRGSSVDTMHDLGHSCGDETSLCHLRRRDIGGVRRRMPSARWRTARAERRSAEPAARSGA